MPVMSRKEKAFFTFVVTLAILAIIRYAVWWFNPAHIPSNWGRGGFDWLDLVFYLALTFVIWHGLVQRIGFWYIVSHMKRTPYQKPRHGLRVAMLTCFVPGKEPYDMLELTLKAMTEVEYPHDTWVLDEGNDDTVKNMCRRLGVRHFSRKGVERYNQPSGPFKAKTKAGNHNAWRDSYEHEYDFVAQMDMDHVPTKDYLDRTLGYFRDPKVGFVVGPQIYGNQENWIARGAAEQAFCFHGPLQQGLNGLGMPLFIGTNHVYRPLALQEAGGYASKIVEDHLTGMRMLSKGWKGIYVPEIIAVGEGPSTWEEYLNQQTRWSYGIFEIVRDDSPRLLLRFNWKRRLGYFFIQTYYLAGVTMALSVILTSLYLLFGVSAGAMDIWQWVYHAMPPFIISVFIERWSQRFYLDPEHEKGLGLKGMFLTLGALPIYFRAFLLVAFFRKLQYVVTAKGSQVKQDSLAAFRMHGFLILLSLSGLAASAITGNGDAPQLRFWAGFTIITQLVVVASSQRHLLQERPVVQYRRRAAYLGVAFVAVAASTMTIALMQAPTSEGAHAFSGGEQGIALADVADAQEATPARIGTDTNTPVPTKTPLRPTSTPTPTPLPTVTARFVAHDFSGVAVGAWDPDQTLSSVSKISMIFADWNPDTMAYLNTQILTAAKQNQMSLITWEPWFWSPDGSEGIPLQDIVDGKYDNYIQEWGDLIGEYDGGAPVIIRFAHEMDLNGSFPWDTEPELYAPAWRHVYSIIKERAPNAKFLWSPAGYIPNYAVYYPGDEYVDFVGFTVFATYVWQQGGYLHFDELMASMYPGFASFGKPIIIPEVGVSLENLPLEAEWVAKMLASVENYPMLVGLVYYNAVHPRPNVVIDWRLSGTKLEAFLNGISNPYFEIKER